MSRESRKQLCTLAEVREWLTERIAERSGASPRSIDPGARFSDCGLDSMAATGLLAELGSAIGRRLHPTLIWECPTIESLARHVVAEPEQSPAPRGARSGDEAHGTRGAEPIAIVGVACRFPRAPDRDAFWRLLRGGVDGIGEVPRERWSVDAYYSAEPGAPGKMSTRWGGFLEQVDQFDPQFFDISPREAVQMDPQQRLMLELSWESLEDAGVAPRGLKGSQTGVFFGAMWSDYEGASRRYRGDRPAHRHGTGPEHHRCEGVLRAGPAGAQPSCEHRLLLVPRGGSPRVPEPATRRVRSRARRT
ncbi:hypothetical protein BE20_14460 [Sorangium cellulosum]|nr:hypothetical protein BE20_14460 [Sorangium cellulosum]